MKRLTSTRSGLGCDAMNLVDLLFEVDEKSDVASKCYERHESRKERREGCKKCNGNTLRDRHAQSDERHCSGYMKSIGG